MGFQGPCIGAKQEDSLSESSETAPPSPCGDGGRSAGPPRPCLLSRAGRCPDARSRGGVAAMAPAAGAAAYFQRGSLFWFTVITLSFGYYTVRAAAGGLRSGEGASALFTPGPRPTGWEPGEVVQAQSLLPRARSGGEGTRLRNETQAYRSARVLGRRPAP